VAIAEPVVTVAPAKPRLVVIVDDSFAGDVARGLAQNVAKGIWSVSVREVDAGLTSKADPYYGDYPYIVLADKTRESYGTVLFLVIAPPTLYLGSLMLLQTKAG
jgi:hypothetical protein